MNKQTEPGIDTLWQNGAGAVIKVKRIEAGRVHYVFRQLGQIEQGSIKLDFFLKCYTPYTK